MVYYKDTALTDLLNLLDGLIEWQTDNGQRRLEYETALSYFNDLKNAFDEIDTLFYHSKATYPAHKRYGEYVYRYERNSRTSWYACYDISEGIIVINRIISNYLNIEN
ncbi:MAG: hypothetical protein LBQ31_10130 [Bacteroidales bacterium]|nr:hypothetical protein [Bacteroidales bacterium]